MGITLDRRGLTWASTKSVVSTGLPFLALVDADGVVVHREYVALTSQAQLEDLVAEHLGVSS